MSTKDTTANLVDQAKESAKVAEEKTNEAAVAAKEKLTEAGQAVESGVHSAMSFIKEHLPKVVHAEDTPEERRSKALLDEAMGRAGGEDVLGIQSKEVPVVTPKVIAPDSAVAESNRPAAASLVDRANAAVEGVGQTADAALSAPPELKSRMGEEHSAKTLGQVVEEKFEGAKDYLR